MPRVVDKESKKKEIVAAAIKTFAVNGVAKTKMADIAAEARIGKGTIYEYFRSKDEIFSASFHLMFEKFDQIMATRMFKITDPVEKLKILFFSFDKILDEYPPEFLQIWMDFWAEGVRHKNEERLKIFDLNKLYDDYRGVIASILEEGMNKGIFRQNIDPYYVASGLFGASDGLMLQLIMKGPDKFDYKKSIEVLLDAFLNGIKK